MSFRDLKIGHRLNAGFGLVIALMLVMGALSYADVASVARDVDLTTHDRYPKIVRTHAIKDALNETSRYARNVLLLPDDAEAARQLQQMERDAATIATNITELERTVRGARGVELLDHLKSKRDAFEATRRQFAALAADKDAARAYLFAQMRPAQQAYMAALDQLIDYQTSLMSQAADETERVAQQSRVVIVSLLAVTAVLAALVAWLVRRSIVGPLQVAVQAARRVAAGDLTGQIEVTSRDETGELLGALRDMNASLLRIVTEVRAGTDTIAIASGEIATGNLDLSARTEEQASALEETASSMEELTANVHHNADHLREADRLASSAADVASRGGAVVGRVVETMNGITESSRRIEEIITVIDSIAFQTNILALNAAVEAARAGEQGRGFAVVAGEVRNLAHRSASAAKEIKQLIDGSVSRVDEGSRLVAEAGGTMEELVASVRRVTSVLGEIALASKEQDASLAGINQAVVEMDAVTQQNAALVEEAAAASASLEEQAKRLASAVAVFQLPAVQAPEAMRARPLRRSRAGGSLRLAAS